MKFDAVVVAVDVAVVDVVVVVSMLLRTML